jgi:hypothetical protein
MKGDLLRSLDTTFDIEHSIVLALLGKQGEVLVKGRILSLLPTERAPKRLASCIAELKEVKLSTLLCHTSPVAINMVETVLQLLDTMQYGTSPSTEFLTSDFMKTVAIRLPWFCIYCCPTTTSCGAKEVPSQLVGAAAAVAKFEDIQRNAVDAPPTLTDITHITTWTWLLNPDQRKVIKTWTAKAVASMRIKVAPAAKRKGKVEPKPASASAEIASLFD